MITHTIESYWIPSQKKTKSKLQILSIRQNFKFFNFETTIILHATNLLKLLDKMCKYEMDPMSIVEDTERIQFCPHTDRQTDGQGETSIPPFQLRWSGGYNDIMINPWQHMALRGHTELKQDLISNINVRPAKSIKLDVAVKINKYQLFKTKYWISPK